MRILLDTNILVSGLLSVEGAPAKLLQGWLDGSFELVSCQTQINELARVLAYPRIRDRITADQAKDILDSMSVMAILAEPEAPASLSPDPDDDVLLAAAIAARANLIVSGDRSHMLALREAEGIPIITAREAVAKLGL